MYSGIVDLANCLANLEDMILASLVRSGFAGETNATNGTILFACSLKFSSFCNTIWRSLETGTGSAPAHFTPEGP